MHVTVFACLREIHSLAFIHSAAPEKCNMSFIAFGSWSCMHGLHWHIFTCQVISRNCDVSGRRITSVRHTHAILL